MLCVHVQIGLYTIQAEAIDTNDGRTKKRRKANAIDALCCIFATSFFFARQICVYVRKLVKIYPEATTENKEILFLRL